MIIGIIFLAILALGSLIATYKNFQIRFYGVETEGEVVDFKENFDDSDHENKVTSYSPIIRFTVDGKEYQGQAAVSQTHATNVDKGRRVTIIYNPQKPASFVNKNDRSGWVGCLFFILSIIGIIWIVLANR